MRDRSEPTQFNTRIPSVLKETIDAHPESNQEIAARALRKEVGLQDESELDVRIKQKEQRIELVKEEIAELEAELKQYESELEDLKQRREEMKMPEEKYEEELTRLLSKLEDGELDRIIPDSTEIRDLAEEYGEHPDDVHEELQQLAAEQDRRIFNTQFMTAMDAESVNIADKELIGDHLAGDSE